jgi:hypothetical protein
MNSHAPWAAKRSISAWVTARITGRNASTARNVKALLTRARSRVCASPSMLSITLRIQSAMGPVVIP